MDAVTPGHAPRTLVILLLAYGAASLFHFAHNAEFLADYPNMPAGLSRAKVYLAWLGVTAVGGIGYLLARRGYLLASKGCRLAGLIVIAVYAALGFDSLAHYTRAPLSAHTTMMNATIWLEVATAALLFFATARLAVRQETG